MSLNKINNDSLWLKNVSCIALGIEGLYNQLKTSWSCSWLRMCDIRSSRRSKLNKQRWNHRRAGIGPTKISSWPLPRSSEFRTALPLIGGSRRHRQVRKKIRFFYSLTKLIKFRTNPSGNCNFFFFSRSINYCRIFTVLAETYLETLVNGCSGGKQHYALKILGTLLTCVGHHDYEVARITFNLWYRLSEMLYHKNSDELTTVFKPYIERLIGALCHHCQMEPDHVRVKFIFHVLDFSHMIKIKLLAAI